MVSPAEGAGAPTPARVQVVAQMRVHGQTRTCNTASAHNHHTQPPPQQQQVLPFLSSFHGNSFMWTTRGPLSERRENMPSVAHPTAAARRRQRRLRQFLRHERLTVAVLLSERDHHTAPRGQQQARTGEGGTTRPRSGRPLPSVPLPGRSSSSCTRKSPAGGGPRLSLSLGRRSRHSGAPWSSLPTSLP